GGRHGQRVIEIGQRLAEEVLARVQHGLGGCFHGGALFDARRFRPGIVVVNEFVRVAEIRLDPATDYTHPSHVHGGRENAEVAERGMLQEKATVVGDEVGRKITQWDISARLGTVAGHQDVFSGRLAILSESHWGIGELASGFTFTGCTICRACRVWSMLAYSYESSTPGTHSG